MKSPFRALCRHVAASLARAAISPDPNIGRPCPAEILAQADNAGSRPCTPRAIRPAFQWFAELEEHFPRAYLHAYASDLDQLREVSGCTPREAAAYARTYWLAPHIADPGQMLAPPAASD